MTASHTLERGRNAFDERRWGEAFSRLSAADAESSLDGEDLDRLGTVAYLLGMDAAWAQFWSRAHNQFRESGNQARAARCAFWLAFGFINSGEMALAGGWLSRAQRLIEEGQLDCPEVGYLLLPRAIEGCDSDPATSYADFNRAAEIGERFRDADLVALAQHGQGRALIRLGQPAKAMTLLDEVLVAVAAGELSPIVTGDVYCGVIEACHETFDIRRAQEWTSALSRWCESQPELVPYRGQCLVYRAALMQLRGAWPDAMAEAVQACKRLSDPVAQPAAGAAYYQRAEIQRLRGEFGEAEESYHQADRHGRDPQPGLALLRLAQGNADSAAASARRLLGEAHDAWTRSRVLAACVEILLAGGQPAAARAAADELSGIGLDFGSAFLLATAAHAAGAVSLAERDYGAALSSLRKAYAAWREVEAPHEAARTRVLIGLCCRELGDSEGANLELQAARQSFEALGAGPDLVRLAALSRGTPVDAGGLTVRELDILRLVATGRTNRAIGDELVISEKTVARHVSNIFTKLGLSSRAAATAYAYEHSLV